MTAALAVTALVAVATWRLGGHALAWLVEQVDRRGIVDFDEFEQSTHVRVIR